MKLKISFPDVRRLALPSLPLALIFLAIEFLDEVDDAAGGAALPTIRNDLGLTYAQIGLLFAAPHLVNTFIEPIIMLLGDTPLRRRLVLGGGVMFAVASLLFAGAPTFAILLAAELLFFPSSGAFVTLSQTTLVDADPGREAQSMARWTVAGSLGSLAGPLLVTGLFAVGLSWRWAFVLLGVSALALALLLWPRRLPRHPQAADNGPHPVGVKALWKESLANLRQAVRVPILLRWLILAEASDLLLDIFSHFLPLYFTDVVGISAAQAGLALALLTAATLASDLLAVPLLERVPGRTVLRWSALLGLVIYPAWLLVPWFWAKLALLPLIRLCTLGWYPIISGEAYASLPGRSATVAALYSFSGPVTAAINFGLGLAATQFGLQATLWLLLLGPLCLFLGTPAGKSAPVTAGDDD